MIPPDVASSLRQLLPDQATLSGKSPQTQPVSQSQRIADVLREFVPGQRIMAEIQGMQPNGTYRAMVGQRQITLALPFSAKAGDTLELEVKDTDGSLTLAVVASRGEAATHKGGVATALSQTGRLIADLLAHIGNDGQRAPPAALNRNQALIENMPKTGADLAPVLKEALTQSGVFYEAHQARWVAGRFPTEALRQEPQGQLPATPRPTLEKATSGSHTTPQTTSASPFTSPPGKAVTVNLNSSPKSPPLLPGHVVSSEPETAPTVYLRPQNPSAEQTPARLNLIASPSTSEAGEDSALTLSSGTESFPLAPDDNPESTSTTVSNPGGSSETTTSPQKPSTVPQERLELATQLPDASLKHTESSVTTAHRENIQKDEPANVHVTHSRRGNEAETSSSTSATSQNSGGIPRELSTVVQQQLDGLANQNFAWQGQIWPGQSLHWEIATDSESSPQQTGENTRQWHTRLKLNLPQLGGIDAAIHLQPGGKLGISLIADSASSQGRLREGGPELAQQLEAAGLSLTQFQVVHEPTEE